MIAKALLFGLRLLLYLAAVAMPAVHPAVAVAYDRTGFFTWFVVVPVQMLLGFLLPVVVRYVSQRRLYRSGIGIGPVGGVFVAAVLTAVPSVLGLVFVGGITSEAWSFVLPGVVAFVLTAAIFHSGPARTAGWIPEQVLLVVVYVRLLQFSRASDSIAAATAPANQMIVALVVVGLLVHSWVLYRIVRLGTAAVDRNRRELVVFAAIAVPLALVLAFLLPNSFVENAVVLNPLEGRADPEPVLVDEDGDGLPDGNLRGDTDGRNGNDGDGQDGRSSPRLEGIQAGRWGTNGPGSDSQDGDGDGSQGSERQYAVMIVNSTRDDVYAADYYLGDLHPEQGFGRTNDDPFNEISTMRLIETWRDPQPVFERGRAMTDIRVISTLSERYVPYRPVAIEPTTLNREWYPFEFGYRATAAVASARPAQYAAVRELSAAERERLAPYLDVPLADADRAVFQEYLDGVFIGGERYYQRIEAIIQSFARFQYWVGYGDDVSVAALVDFVTNTLEGDCTEFSNTAALLGRLAGVPSRVVTGYLASKALQTDSHIEGLRVLQQALEPIRDIPLDELFLVTSAHRHSWVQFYVPDYGWVDFETTAYAIPPVGLGDANQRNVVIPIIQGMPQYQERPPLPVGAILRALAVAAGSILVGAYVLRYARELTLFARSRRSTVAAGHALFQLLLLRLAARGYVPKPPAETAQVYAGRYQELAQFATIYGELRYRLAFGEGEVDELLEQLRKEYRTVLAAWRPKHPWLRLSAPFSLRGLGYRW